MAPRAQSSDLMRGDAMPVQKADENRYKLSLESQW
jgi:hypothetical protein